MSRRLLAKASWGRATITIFVVFAAIMTIVMVTGAPAAALPASPTDSSKVPHYFGPWPNWALSPLTMPDVTVTINGSGTGAKAQATVGGNGAVTSLTITDPGRGYSAATVSITGAGTGATGTASVTLTGVVTAVSITSPGSGYKTPVAAVSGGGATTQATVEVFGVVDALQLVTPGSGYSNPTVDFDLPDDPDGVQATGHVEWDAGTGAITGIFLDNQGSGYAHAPGVVIRDGTLFDPIIGGTGATASATLAIDSAKAVTYGAGYTSTPSVSISDSTGSGTGASAAALTDSGAVTGITLTAPGSGYITAGGMKKFQDGLPVLCDPAAGWDVCVDNNLGQHIPIGVPDTVTFSTATGFALDADYYVIALVQHREQMSSSLPAQGTLLREYVQLETPANAAVSKHIPLMTDLPNGTSVPTLMPDGSQAYGVDDPHYLGPLIVAAKDKPVRIVFYNLLPTGSDGDLFLPVDSTLMGSGYGPLTSMIYPADDGTVMDLVRNQVCSEADKGTNTDCFKDNRATLHLHGGITPWISDGTPHQWITPANEDTPWPEGVATGSVPDMSNAQGVPDCSEADDGCSTFYYTNQQSARLMFYHDHAWGITRLNVYAGEAAGYIITDDTEQKLIDDGVIPSDQIPLIIQDRTFVPDSAQLAEQDPTWDYTRWGSYGDFWYHHVYMPAQNPGDPSGMSGYGRWMYGPWFWPPATTALYQPIANPYYDPNCNLDDPSTWTYQTDPFCEPELMPGTPNISAGMEQFNDTPIVNGTAYPTTTVDPKAYRLRILNAANDRFFNLQWYVADPTTGTLSEVAFKASELEAAQTDPNIFPTPDTSISPAGPSWIQIGTEGGFLPAPVVVPNQPITWITDPTRFDVGNVDKHALLVAPAERVDVIVDFSRFAGQTLILYNDAPAAFPARVPSYDYYTGAPDQSPVGAPAILPGYGPNTRTVMQVNVAATTPAAAFNLSALQSAFRHKADGSGVFESGQHPIIVGQSTYNSAYGTSFPAGSWCNAPGSTSTSCDGYARISEQGGDLFGFNTLLLPPGTGKLSIPLEPKAIHDEMNSASFDEFGRMSANIGLETVPATPATQNITLYPYINPATEFIDATGLPVNDVQIRPISTADGTQIWKITHNGVDTHPIHFHLYDVQLLNRVTWDNIIIPPDATELGWKDTVRVSPLEDTIVALRPIVPALPFEIPNSIRPLSPMMALHESDFFNSVKADGTPGATITNELTNFGWEYVWHCHILSHEEMDMMRPQSLAVPPYVPDGLAAVPLSDTQLTVYWNDTSISETSFDIQRSSDNTIWDTLETIPAALDAGNTHGAQMYVDNGYSPATWYYRVIANNTVGYGGDYMSLNVTSTSTSVLAGDPVGSPTITGLQPAAGPTGGGNNVIITGTNFIGMVTADGVTFDGTNASYVVDSATQITAVAPLHGLGTVDVQVNALGGSSPNTAADNYLYTNAPTVTDVSPNTGTNVGGTVVVITGTGFELLSGPLAVTFGGTPAASYTVDSPTQITATTPARPGGTVQVQVTNAAGGSPSNPPNDEFTFVAPPVVTGLSPNAGTIFGGTIVTITGHDFGGLAGPSAVTFGGVDAISYTLDSTTQITATSPVHAAGTVQVQVTAAGGPSADVAADNFTYVPPTTIEQTDPHITYVGTWYGGVSPSASGGTFAYAEAQGAGALVKFVGTSIAVVGKKSPVYGMVAVQLDNQTPVVVDLYSSVTVYQQTIVQLDGLTNGPHTLTIKCLHDKNAASSGYFINLDALRVVGALGFLDRHEQNAAQLTYSGPFSAGWSPLYSGGSFRHFNTPGNAVNVKFQGQYVAWIAKKSPLYGKAQVTVDGGPSFEVDLYSASTLYQQKVYETGLLDEGEHTLSIYWTGAKSPAASDTNVSIDAFDVVGTLVTAPVAVPLNITYQQNDSRITYLGHPWYQRAIASASGGSFTYTDGQGAGALINFEGTSVAWMGKMSPVYGMASVQLDNQTPVVVDLYSASEVYQQTLWQATGLVNGPHTLTIRCLYDKNAASSGYFINLDALNITGTLVSSAGLINRYEQNAAQLTYTGPISAGWTALASAGSFRYFNSPGNTVTVTFQGQHLAWIAKESPTHGIASVSLDGGPAEMVDLYNASTVYQQEVYTTGVLDAGEHTLVIQWTGNKNLASSDTFVNVDAFDVVGTLVTPAP